MSSTLLVSVSGGIPWRLPNISLLAVAFESMLRCTPIADDFIIVAGLEAVLAARALMLRLLILDLGSLAFLLQGL